MAQRYDRFPMGNGQAPGMATGLGVSGAGGSAAGWAVRASGAGFTLGAAGFFLAAFFLADFSVGFFLAVFFAAPDALAVLRFALPAAFLTFPALRAGAFRDRLPADLLLARRVTLFFFAPLFFFAGFLRAALFAFAMPHSFVHPARLQ